MSKTLTFSDEQLQLLRAAWTLVGEEDDFRNNMADALEIPPEDRGLDEDGDETDDYNEESDPIVQLIESTSNLIMND